MLSSRPTDAHIFPSKTPGRTKGRGENAIRGPMTVQGKGKEAVGKTSFHPTSSHPEKPFKDGASAQPSLKSAAAPARSTTRPLVDKTPFPNRTGGQQFQTPLPQGSKLAGLSFLEPGALLQFDKTPDALLLPSSTRKHSRTPRNSGKNFETPLNRGNHWDVSDISIATPEPQVQETIIEDDYDEIEYMAPNTLDLPYQPPFDFELPDYTELGKALLKFGRSPHYDDQPVPEIDFPADQIEILPWDMLDLPKLGTEDPFHQTNLGAREDPKPPAQLGAQAQGKLLVTSRPGASLKPSTISRTPSARTTTISNQITATRTTRPGTVTSSSTSTSRPTTLKRANTTANITTGAVTSTLKTGTISRNMGLKSGIPAMKPVTSTTGLRNKPSIPSIPPRPATSISIRAKATANSNNAVPLRRPTTSAAMYKTNVKKPVAVQYLIPIQGDFDMDDDFKFDV